MLIIHHKMMKILYPTSFHTTLATFFLSGFVIITGCTAETRLLNNIPVHSVEVKVVDQDEGPVQGAQVEASNGRQTTTDEKGLAKIRFGSVGVHAITVFADNRLPVNFVVTMPADRGKTITQKLANEISFSSLNFSSMNMYPLLFNYIFSSYGYSPELKEYEEGQSTTWEITTGADNKEPLRMGKAFLKKMENGQKWWQIVLTQPGEDTPEYIAEMLFSEDLSSVLRFREKIGDSDVQEKLVSKGWYNKPAKLTEESEQGAVKEGNISVNVPKGTFKADVLEFGIAPGTSLKIWRAKMAAIPGGVVKYETTSEEDIVYRSELQNYGTDSGTLLDSY